MRGRTLVVAVVLAAGLALTSGCATAPVAPAPPDRPSEPAQRPPSVPATVSTAGVQIVHARDSGPEDVGKPIGPDRALTVDSDSIASIEVTDARGVADKDAGVLVVLTFTTGGRRAMSTVTTYRFGTKLAVVKNGILVVAWTPKESITDGKAVVSVDATGAKVLGLEAP